MENLSAEIKPKIIIIDDDKLALLTMQVALKETYEVITCTDPIEGLDKIKGEDFDILISDYNMPKLSGIELIKGAMQIKPDLLAIVVTGFANKEITLEALRNGAYDFIEKPIIPEILTVAVSRAWEKIKILKDNEVLIKEIKKYNEKLEDKNLSLAFKNEELKTSQKLLETNNEKREMQFMELQKAQSDVLRSAMKAGMSEVATNILHNVGNILNSVNASTNFLNETINNSKAELLFSVIDLIKENQNNLAEFLTNDNKGKLIPILLTELKEALSEENKNAQYELTRLTTNVDHIKTIITFQQNYATQPLMKEEFTINNLIEEALAIIKSEYSNSSIQINFSKKTDVKLFLTKHKLLHLLINIIRNSKDSLLESPSKNKEITILVTYNPLQITIEDNGVGIAKENIDKIFNHGFTTKKLGHGFGLHSCLIAANDIGSKISVESEGFGKGARFILTFPE